MIAGAGLHESVLIAVAVLIITCPCALGLAVPVAQVVVAGSLMRAGILVKDGAALERLAAADMVVLDKTGTITLGRPVLEDGLEALWPDERRVALALARASRHPLSRALTAALEQQGVTAVQLDRIVEQPGFGIEGYHAGQLARLGRPDWAGVDADAGATVLVTAFSIEGGPVRLLRFADTMRPDAAAAIGRLRDQGLAPAMLSGDRKGAAEAIGGALRIDVQAELTPAAKVAAIDGLQRQGRHVLMVGDGLNDGPALKAADVSMAPSSASDVGQMAADLVFLGDGLMAVPAAVRAARATMRVVRQNFALAIGYNVLAVPLAVAGLVTPLVAALAMSGSSLIVVGNALRLRNAAR
jgi:Cu2+-exporting ATPase